MVTSAIEKNQEVWMWGVGWGGEDVILMGW